MSDALTVKNLVITSAKGPIVRGVSFEVSRGSPLTILGDSGSGKSLILHAIMGTLAPELHASGMITLGDRDLLQLTAQERRALWGRTLSLLPQEPWLALDPTMRLLPQIAEVHRHVRNVGAADSATAAQSNLAAVNLAGAAELRPFQMSGGMCQRAIIAIAHAGDSQLMLCDEPTKSIDRPMRDATVARLRAELERNRLLVTVTHDIAVARGLGGTVAIMRDGDFIETGVVSEILQRPQHAYTRQFVGADPESWPHTAPGPTGDVVIEARGLAKRYGARTVFENVDIDISAGEIVAIVGPSGCGKTTLGNVLLGLTHADAGIVTRRYGQNTLRAQKLYQDPPSAFAPHQFIRAAIDDLARRHRIERSRMIEWMDKLRLGPDLLDRLPGEVSGGELQRFALLRAMLLDPVFLFADEATSRLDPIGQRNVIDMLTEAARRDGTAILLVTHDPMLAERTASRVLTFAERGFVPTITSRSPALESAVSG